MLDGRGEVGRVGYVHRCAAYAVAIAAAAVACGGVRALVLMWRGGEVWEVGLHVGDNAFKDIDARRVERGLPPLHVQARVLGEAGVVCAGAVCSQALEVALGVGL